jgi:DNA-binding PadR family transcriptional regulator
MQRSPTELLDLGRFEEPAVLILTSLLDGPRHGYAIVRDVEQVAGVRLGPGTL